jgi:O-antigen/teichoic acid export membrane protein
MVAQSSSKRLALGSMASMGGRISSAVSQLLITGILARTLDPNAFGLWALLYTVYTLMPNLDLGFGQALRLKLADLSARGGQVDLEARLFWSVSFLLLIFGTALGILVGFIMLLLPSIETNFRLIFFFFAISCGLTIAFNLGTQVFYAYEEGFERGILDISQAILLALTVWMVSRTSELGFAIVAFYSVALIFNFIAVLWFVQKRQWKLKIPTQTDVQQTSQEIWHSSLSFWLLAVFAGGIFGTLPLFIAGATNLEQVGHFVILQRLFAMLITLHYAWLSPLQSAYTRAVARSEWAWARSAWQHSRMVTVIGMIGAGGALLWLHQPLVLLWTGKQLFEPNLVIVLACWACLWTWVNVNSMVLNGMGIIQPQVQWLIIGFVIHVLLNLVLIPRIGVIGAPIATMVAILPLAFLNFFWVRHQLTRGLV